MSNLHAMVERGRTERRGNFKDPERQISHNLYSIDTPAGGWGKPGEPTHAIRELERDENGNLDFDNFTIAVLSPTSLSLNEVYEKLNHPHEGTRKAYKADLHKRWLEYQEVAGKRTRGAAESRRLRELQAQRQEMINQDPDFFSGAGSSQLPTDEELRKEAAKYGESAFGEISSLATLSQEFLQQMDSHIGQEPEKTLPVRGARASDVERALQIEEKKDGKTLTERIEEINRIGSGKGGDDLFRKGKELIDRDQKNQGWLNDKEAEEQSYQLQLDENKLNEKRLRQAATDKAVLEVEQSIDSIQKQIDDWSIDPSRAFPTTWSMIGAALASAVGAFAQGISSKQIGNSALNIIQKAIDRDIQAQKAEYTKLKGSVQDKNNIIARLIGQDNDMDVAEAEAYAILYNNSAQRIKQYQSTAKTEAQQIASEGSILALEEATRKQQNAAQEKKKDRLMKGAILESQQAHAETMANARGKGASASPKDLKNTRRMIGRVKESLSKMDFLDKGYALSPGLTNIAAGWLKSPEARIYMNDVNLATQSITRYFQGGRPSNYDVAAMLLMFPTGMSIFDEESAAKILDNLDLALAEAGGEGLRRDTLREIVTKYGGEGIEGKMATLIAEGHDGEPFEETYARVVEENGPLYRRQKAN